MCSLIWSGNFVFHFLLLLLTSSFSVQYLLFSFKLSISWFFFFQDLGYLQFRSMMPSNMHVSNPAVNIVSFFTRSIFLRHVQLISSPSILFFCSPAPHCINFFLRSKLKFLSQVISLPIWTSFIWNLAVIIRILIFSAH